MIKYSTLSACLVLALALATPARAGPEGHAQEETSDEHKHGDSDGHGDEEGLKEGTRIDDEAANAAGIVLEPAGPAQIRESVATTGKIILNPNRTATIKARFPGVVRRVEVQQGETVKAGQVLATVESNNSLQVYPVKAPINGTVLTRDTNPGDVAGDAALFTISDLDAVWGEFHVFPRDVARIRTDQEISVTSTDGARNSTGHIASFLPVAEAETQTVVARATINNEQGLWRPGMAVRGDVAVSQKSVAVAVKLSALQREAGRAVVYVKAGEEYTARPVTLGIRDSSHVEIISGLAAGESYVSENSFIVKADIGKAGAEHTH